MHKNNTKWIKDLKVRPVSIKVLLENIGGKLLDIGLVNDFWNVHPKHRQQKQK